MTQVAGAAYCHNCGAKQPCASSSFRLACVGPFPNERSIILDGQNVIIGSAADCELAIPEDRFLSRQHARLAVLDGRLVVEDLASSNGTLMRIQGVTPLKCGDEIVVGTCRITIEKSPS